MMVFQKGNKINLGRIRDEQTREKISLSKKGKKNPRVSNENHGQWKGKNVGMSCLHSWIKRRKPMPNLCENCKINPPRDLANISGEYKRDVNDFKWICRKCHMKEDGRSAKVLNNLKQYKEVK
jgi:hypothetical protein